MLRWSPLGRVQTEPRSHVRGRRPVAAQRRALRPLRKRCRRDSVTSYSRARTRWYRLKAALTRSLLFLDWEDSLHTFQDLLWRTYDDLCPTTYAASGWCHGLGSVALRCTGRD